mmetsp:Transcript_17962/g.33473  ORF Transcript_17962/g.33473 Transcript_17962/m.33473 type:complete len:201 (+) Transcript_17962:919-1521(+)
MLPQLINRLGRLPHPPASLERERLGHDTDRQRPALLADLGDDGGGTRSGPSPHAGGDEAEVGAGDHGGYFLAGLLGGEAAHVWVASGAEAAGDGGADVEDLGALGLGAAEGLGVGVDGPEFDASYAGVEHAIDRITTTSTHTQHLNHTGTQSTIRHQGRGAARKCRRRRSHRSPLLILLILLLLHHHTSHHTALSTHPQK